MSYMLATNSFSVPQTILKRKVEKARENNNDIKNLKMPLEPKFDSSQDEEDSINLL